MIIVRVDLVSKRGVERLGAMTISNVGGTAKRGNYEAKVGRKTDAVSGDWNRINDKPLREADVRDYPRLSYNVWRLVIRALLGCFPEEKS